MSVHCRIAQVWKEDAYFPQRRSLEGAVGELYPSETMPREDGTYGGSFVPDSPITVFGDSASWLYFHKVSVRLLEFETGRKGTEVIEAYRSFEDLRLVVSFDLSDTHHILPVILRVLKGRPDTRVSNIEMYTRGPRRWLRLKFDIELPRGVVERRRYYRVSERSWRLASRTILGNQDRIGRWKRYSLLAWVDDQEVFHTGFPLYWSDVNNGIEMIDSLTGLKIFVEPSRLMTFRTAYRKVQQGAYFPGFEEYEKRSAPTTRDPLLLASKIKSTGDLMPFIEDPNFILKFPY